MTSPKEDSRSTTYRLPLSKRGLAIAAGSVAVIWAIQIDWLLHDGGPFRGSASLFVRSVPAVFCTLLIAWRLWFAFARVWVRRDGVEQRYLLRRVYIPWNEVISVGRDWFRAVVVRAADGRVVRVSEVVKNRGEFEREFAKRADLPRGIF